MEIVVLVCNPKQKATPSTTGMATSVRTCPLMKERCELLVPKRIVDSRQAIAPRNFDEFARITMQESDSLRDVCMATDPPIDYWTPQSHAIIKFVKTFNSFYGSNRCCYTFDAGPNAFLFTTTADLPGLLKAVQHCFPTPTSQWILQSPSLADQVATHELPAGLLEQLDACGKEAPFVQIFHSKVGTGPSVVEDTESLIAPDGTPRL
eukprot:NODE_4589_length_1043_cov_74.098913_g4386_i0.p1 GENE.NODE_4589_length_1043_cov_74.098913_g4386_i0~~NODE_4589_length_1043_cov_74.098913_g4386_i0.p1  ORF type:complete len:207 (+),score=25.82 NODE_4589_length_1043_cov_74.098913_g4386_i0:370-990(+)